MKSSSVKVSIPQSVWWMSTISVVPSSRWLIASERISSSVTDAAGVADHVRLALLEAEDR